MIEHHELIGPEIYKYEGRVRTPVENQPGLFVDERRVVFDSDHRLLKCTNVLDIYHDRLRNSMLACDQRDSCRHVNGSYEVTRVS